MKKIALLLFAFAVCFCAAPLNAQGGCVDSPENPTVVLALIGSAGAFAASARSRFRARKRKTGG